MRLKLLSLLLIAFLTFLKSVSIVHADTAGSSAALMNKIQTKSKDNRAAVLQQFLENYNSPLAPYSNTFVTEADKNKIDWKLVVSIAGNESQFGQLIPAFSYNGWGFGVYGNNVRRFSSWKEGIEVVSKSMRTDYIDKLGTTNIYEIGSMYAEDPAWANKVMVYKAQLDEFETQSENASLPISF